MYLTHLGAFEALYLHIKVSTFDTGETFNGPFADMHLHTLSIEVDCKNKKTMQVESACDCLASTLDPA